MKLIAGLGNPGFEYVLTPHNLGFMAVDRLAEILGLELTRPEAQALTARGRWEGHEVILAKPQTYMNLSGQSIARLLDRYEIQPEDLLVFVDELDLPLGSLRIRSSGSAGSHNGLKSIIGSIQSDRFIRIRMGVGPDHPVADRASLVLGRFRKADLETVAEMVDRAVQSASVILNEGIQTAMNRYNQRIQPPES
ncbi:MAG TPA: aminoacyl-tRNA hydrolase [Terriglobia bacterium]|nr:aminoacyl-tRNA hydrolase [Terriglobia bacterium]